MNNPNLFYRFSYNERLDDKIYAKQLFYKSLETLNKKHVSMFLDHDRDGVSYNKIAKKFGYTLGSVKAIISEIRAFIISFLQGYLIVSNN
jgi:DNA-directed RNA polymerase specialized sigma24 family protein